MTLLEQLECELAEGGPRPWSGEPEPIRVCRRGHKVFPWSGRQRSNKGGWWECSVCEEEAWRRRETKRQRLSTACE